MGPQQPRQVKINVNPDQLKDRICECGGTYFTDGLRLKEIPALYSPSGKPETMMMKIGFICVGCGKLMSLRPEEEKPKLILAGGN